MGLFKSIKNPLKSVGDLVGGVLNSLTGVSDTAKQSYSDSVKLMNLENANNIALWNMQNAYDTPSAQIARMKDAGIDVNPMTYAVGNGSMSTTASNVATASPHMPSYSSAGNPISNLVQLITGLEQADAIRAGTKQTEQQTKKTEEETNILKRRSKIISETGIDPADSGPVGWSASAAHGIKEVYGKVEKLTFDILESIFGKKGGYRPMD